MEHYDFSCWVIKYGRVSINGKIYQKDSLKNSDVVKVPLLWNHKHHDPTQILGHATLEYRDEGVYAYCTLNDFADNKKNVIALIRDKGTVALSMYINRVKYDGKYIVSGVIREVSLVLERIDPDEAYYPVMNKEVLKED